MKIHGTAMSVPDMESLKGEGAKFFKLWAVLRKSEKLVALSPARLPRFLGFIYRFMAWLRYPSSLRFGKVNLRPEVFERRSASALRSIRSLSGEVKADLVLQVGFFFSTKGSGLPYAVYVDATAAMVERHYPDLVPWSKGEAMRDKWMSKEKQLYQEALCIFTYTEFCKKSICDDYGIHPERVSVVYPGLNFPPVTIQPEAPKKRTYRAIFVGYDFSRKGGDVLLHAWSMVRGRFPEAELLIVGPYCEGIPSAPGVICVGPVSSREALSAYYKSADVFCMPSIFEPYGHVFLEAMAHGLPCVGANCGAMPEIITPGRNGLLADPGSPESLALCLIRLFENEALYLKSRQGALATASAWNRWEDSVSQIVQRLEQECPKS